MNDESGYFPPLWTIALGLTIWGYIIWIILAALGALSAAFGS